MRRDYSARMAPLANSFLQKLPPLWIPGPLRELIGWRIKQLTGSTSSPDAFAQPAGDPGLFGPSSMAWRVHAHFVGMMVGGLSSLMMQSLHPRALAAVWDHSNFRHNLKGRLGRTAYFVAITTYGAKNEAIQAIERVNQIHAQVKGFMPDASPYVANEPALLRWVHLGEVTSFLNGYQLLSTQPLSSTEADTYAKEMTLVGELLGAEQLPSTAQGNLLALQEFIPELVCNARTREILQVIENYPVDIWDKPFMHLVIQASFHILPDWALQMLGKPLACEAEKFWVRQALSIATAPIQSVLDTEGVAAHARRRAFATT